MMRIFMVVVCSLLAVCSVSAQISRREGTDGQAAIYRLPPFERAVCCTKFFEGWPLGKTLPIRGIWAQTFAGRKVFGTYHDEAAGGRAPAERPAEVLRNVPEVPEG